MNVQKTDKGNLHLHVPIWRFDEYAMLLDEHNLGIELYIGTHSIDKVTLAVLNKILHSIDRSKGLSVHGPFLDLSPGAEDALVSRASLERYMQVMSFCKILKPDVVVFHSGCEAWKFAGDIEPWLERSAKTWKTVLEQAEKTGTRIAIENVTDKTPDHLIRLADHLNHELFGLCLDVGHCNVHSFSDAAGWATQMGKLVFEVHLHDNSGAGDEHLPAGDGTVGFEKLFGVLKALVPGPLYTIESRTADDALKSLQYLSKWI